MPDLEPGVSPIYGRIISGRKALRDHDKEHGVTNMADFKETWEKAAKERAKLFTPGAGYDRKRRIEQIKENYERLRNRMR